MIKSYAPVVRSSFFVRGRGGNEGAQLLFLITSMVPVQVGYAEQPQNSPRRPFRIRMG